MKNRLRLFLLVLICACTSFVFTNCKSTKEIQHKSELFKRTVEDSDKFYEIVHSDSLLQESRIKFPLEGMSIDGTGEKLWTKENLPRLKVMVQDVDTTKFQVYFKKTDKDFTQKFWIENSGFSSECRFELISRKWFLVYVYDQNF